MVAQAPGGEVLVYAAPDGGVRVEVRLDRDTVWLTQRQMSELFETTPENVLMHLKNIYADGELEEPRWATGSPRAAACVFANGPRKRCATTWYAATPSTGSASSTTGASCAAVS